MTERQPERQPSRHWIAALLALAALAGAPAAARAGSDVPLGTAAATTNLNPQVKTVVVDGSGRTYLGGSFTAVHFPALRVLKLTASSDRADRAFPQVNGAVSAVAADGSGGWFVGGGFTAVGGVTRNHLAHILSDGSLDPTWNPNANAGVYALAVSGSDVYVGGSFTQLNGGTARRRLAKIPIAGDGTIDPDWDPNVGTQFLGTVSALAVSGSDLFVGGAFTTINGETTTRNRLAKIPTSGDGTVDPDWDPNANSNVNALAVSGSDVFVGGAFTTINGGTTTRNRLAKIPAAGDGTVDASWDPNASGGVNALAVSGSDLYVGGFFTTLNGATMRNNLAKIPTGGDGTVDLDWDPNASDGSVSALAVSGGDVYAGGLFRTLNGGTARSRLAKIPTAGDGTVDPGWDPNVDGTVDALAASGSDVFAGGIFTGVNAVTRNHLARLNADGSLDATWNPNANAEVLALALSGSDLYVGGRFSTLNGTTARHNLAKIPTAGDGTVDASWDPDVSGPFPSSTHVDALAVSGSDLFVGGFFTTVNGTTTRNRLAKVSTAGTGTVDPDWNPNASSQVNALAVSGSDVFVGGGFTTLNGGTARNRLAKIPGAGDGTVDPDWDPDVFGSVNALAVSGSDIFVGGAFFELNGGTTRNRLAKIPAAGDGTVDPDWNPNADNTVHALAVSGSDVYVGGAFTTLNGSTGRNHLARIAASGDGTVDAGWDPNADGNVLGLSVSGARLAAGGEFTTVGPRSNQGVVLFTLLAVPTLTHTASVDVGLGGQVYDTATLAGGSSPTGTITFTLYGPDDASCSGAPAFTDAQSVDSGNGPYTSADFTPTQPGTYRWIATYTGDSNNNPASTSCDDPNGEVLVFTESDLTIAKSHAGDFTQGQIGATYTISVANVGSAATSGTVTMIDTLPDGLTPTAPNGTVNGWTCGIAGPTVSCARSDALGVGGSYPGLALTVNVAFDAAPMVTNTASVSGGGQSNTANDIASDPTTILQLSAGVTVDPTAGLTTTEAGGTDTFTVVLDSPPSGEVVIDLASTDPTEGTVLPAQITFTGGVGGNWATPRTVTVTGVDDTTDDGDQEYEITVAIDTVLTEDPDYDAIDPADVSATNLDDEGPGDLIFGDGFESGDTGEWSTTSPVLQPLLCDPASAAPDRNGDPFGACALGEDSPGLTVDLPAPALQGFSFVGWVQLGQVGRRSETLVSLTDAAGQLLLSIATGGTRVDRPRVEVVVPGGGRAVSEPLGPGLVNFHWYHVAFVYDGSAATLDYYLGGELQARLTGIPATLPARKATFGDGPAGAIDGAFDETSWASYRLRAEEVADRAADGR